MSMGKAQSFSKPNHHLLGKIGKEVRKLRIGKKLTMEELADMCDLHYKYIQTIEAGKRNVSISVFVAVARALEVEPAALLRYVQR